MCVILETDDVRVTVDENDRLVLFDLEMVTRGDVRHTSVVGTENRMAPEVKWSWEYPDGYDYAADLYSLSKTVLSMMAHVKLCDEVKKTLRTVLDILMSHEPEKRKQLYMDEETKTRKQSSDNDSQESDESTSSLESFLETIESHHCVQGF